MKNSKIISNNSGKNNPRFLDNKIREKKCKHCKRLMSWWTEFRHLPISIFTKKICCSYQCSNTLNKLIENRKDKDKKNRIKKCEGCGKKMDWSADYRKKAISVFIKMKFCTKACADIHGFRYTGKDHTNFKEDARRKNRRGGANRWTNNVYNRDSYTCQKCKASGTKVILHAHHIKSMAHYPKLKWNLDNGITLCIDCHHKVHEYKKFEGKAIISFKHGRRSIRVKKKCSSCKVNLFIKPSDLMRTSGNNKGTPKKDFYCNKRCMGDHFKVIRAGKPRANSSKSSSII